VVFFCFLVYPRRGYGLCVFVISHRSVFSHSGRNFSRHTIKIFRPASFPNNLDDERLHTKVR